MRGFTWLEEEGSTRPMGVLRILLVLIAWNRWGDELLPYHDLSPSRLALSVGFYVTTAWMLAGWYGRLATACAAAVVMSIVYLFGRTWGMDDWTHHHTTILAHSFALLALTPNSTSFSVDRWLAVRRALRAGQPPPPERGPTWAHKLIALQVSTVYFWSAYDKSTIQFLSGMRLEQIFVEEYWSSDFWSGPAVRAIFAVMAISVVVGEYGLAFGLWWRRIRTPMVLAGIVLHALIFVLLPVGTFSVNMLALYLAYLDPDGFHRFLDRWMGHLAVPEPAEGR